MEHKVQIFILGGLFLSALLLAAYFFAAPSITPQAIASQPSPQSITILWADWAPANSLKELVKDFEKETGIRVNVETESWDTFQSRAFEVLDAKGQEFDMVIGDSQWLGLGATRGHYVDITKWIKDNGLENKIDEKLLRGYGEYPKGSGRYWAVPVEGDTLGWAYRKDLFENSSEKEAFLKKYGYELQVPDTWNQLRDIAEFFYRPEQNFYGVGIPTGVAHDSMTMGMQNVLWAWGGNLGDYQTYKVKGILNSKESIAGLAFYKELYQFTPPGWNDAFYTQSNDYFKNGSVAMIMNYFAFYPDLADPAKNSFADRTGYFKMPAGPKARVASLGGQGISVIGYSKKKDSSFRFLEWFIKDGTQRKWAQLGGYTTHKSILNSEEFLTATPYNRVFKESMELVQDFWAVPEYTDLLALSQQYWSEYVTQNKTTAEETMNKLAREWENIFEYAGYYKE